MREGHVIEPPTPPARAVRRRAVPPPVATWLALVAFLLIAAVLAYRTAHKLAPTAHPDAWAMTDFRDTIYYPAVAFLAGRNPYDPSFAVSYPVQRPLPPYGPLIVLLHLPLALLLVGAAEATYFVVTLALTLAVAGLALRAGDHEAAPWAVLALGFLILASRPGHQNLLLGQCTLEVVLGVYLAFVFARDRPFLAALGVAVTTMKPQFALPLVLMLLVSGERVVVAVGLILAAVLSLAALLVGGGAAGLSSWRGALARTGDAATGDSFMWYLRIDLGYLARQIAHLTGGGAIDLIAAALVLVVGAVAVRRARVPGAALAASPLAVTAACLTVLVSMYHLTYDALLLTLPIVALARARAAGITSPATRVVLLALLLVPAVNYLATESVIRALDLQGGWWLLVTGANGIALLAALLVSAAATPGSRSSDARRDSSPGDSRRARRDGPCPRRSRSR